MHEKGTHTVKQIAEVVGVSCATVHRTCRLRRRLARDPVLAIRQAALDNIGFCDRRSAERAIDRLVGTDFGCKVRRRCYRIGSPPDGHRGSLRQAWGHLPTLEKPMLHPSRILAAMAAGCAVSACFASSAGADPAHGFIVPLDCTDGNSYTTVTNGNGEFTPTHDTASNKVFIPTRFGPFHGTVTDSGGNVVDEFTDPGVTKGRADRPRRTAVECTYEFEQTFEDPDLGELTFTGDGTVYGFTTPAR
jgi:hypothetical protein